ncbi:MAG: 30S ribosomal protein S8 [Candidatus Krumholzibacteriota bacterium]|nr:30S ribosomal protein S8 [Candidatus Krumholzibacteriota bacterium]HMA76367.1 30S ribosomal protein S8 [Candidatus Krumholzibacteriaceae bacterium]
MMTDPIADMLTRMRNAYRIGMKHVDIPASKIKAEIAKVLLTDGFIKDIKYYDDGLQGVIRIYLKYTEDDKSVIEKIERVSLPSRRVYVGKDNIPRVMGGLGTAIISTSRGVMTGRKCRSEGIGGEVLCHVW